MVCGPLSGALMDPFNRDEHAEPDDLEAPEQPAAEQPTAEG